MSFPTIDISLKVFDKYFPELSEIFDLKDFWLEQQCDAEWALTVQQSDDGKLAMVTATVKRTRMPAIRSLLNPLGTNPEVIEYEPAHPGAVLLYFTVPRGLWSALAARSLAGMPDFQAFQQAWMSKAGPAQAAAGAANYAAAGQAEARRQQRQRKHDARYGGYATGGKVPPKASPTAAQVLPEWLNWRNVGLAAAAVGGLVLTGMAAKKFDDWLS